MADIELVIKIPEYVYRNILEIPPSSMFAVDCDMDIRKGIQNGTLLPKGYSFIAIRDSDFPITEIIKADKAESEERNDTNSTTDL